MLCICLKQGSDAEVAAAMDQPVAGPSGWRPPPRGTRPPLLEDLPPRLMVCVIVFVFDSALLFFKFLNADLFQTSRRMSNFNVSINLFAQSMYVCLCVNVSRSMSVCVCVCVCGFVCVCVLFTEGASSSYP